MLLSFRRYENVIIWKSIVLKILVISATKCGRSKRLLKLIWWGERDVKITRENISQFIWLCQMVLPTLLIRYLQAVWRLPSFVCSNRMYFSFRTEACLSIISVSAGKPRMVSLKGKACYNDVSLYQRFSCFLCCKLKWYQHLSFPLESSFDRCNKYSPVAVLSNDISMKYFLVSISSRKRLRVFMK